MKGLTWRSRECGCESKTPEFQKFDTGAVRDRPQGVNRGRFDLVSPIAIETIAKISAEGMNEKYEPRNWEKGIPLSNYLDSLQRHLTKHLYGMIDEDHLGRALWNLHSLVHTKKMIEVGNLPVDLDDLPNYGLTTE